MKLLFFICVAGLIGCSHRPQGSVVRQTASDVSVEINVKETGMTRLYERVLEGDLSFDISRCEANGAFRAMGSGRVCEMRFANLHLKQELYVGNSESPDEQNPILFVDSGLIALYLPPDLVLSDAVVRLQNMAAQGKIHKRQSAYRNDQLVFEWSYPKINLRRIKFATGSVGAR